MHTTRDPRRPRLPGTLSLALLLGLLPMFPGSPAWAQPPSETFTERTEVTVVEVPVIVLRKGEPVRGLTAENFEIIDGRDKREVLAADVVDLDPVAGESVITGTTALPAAARRHFLLLFDLSFSGPAELLRARAAAQELVAEDLHPTDLVGVASFSVLRGPQLVLPFTSDRRQAVQAIQGLGLPQVVGQPIDPLGFVLANESPAPSNPDTFSGEPTQGPSTTVGPGELPVDAEIRDTLEQIAREERRASRAVDVAAAMSYAQSLEILANALRDVDGRKHLILLSEGFDSSVLLGTDDVQQMQAAAESSASGEYWEVESNERFGSTTHLAALDDRLEAFRRADFTIQAVDIGGIAGEGVAGGSAGSDNSLFLFADGTGGQMFRNFNDLGAAMNDVLEDTSVTYLLSFQPEDLERDGSFRPLKVKLKGVPGRVEVLHRPGYFAPRPYEELSPMERRLEAAELVQSGAARGEIASDVLASVFPVAGEPAYVPLLIEVDGPSLLAGRSSGQIPLEVYTYATDGQGTVRDFFTQSFAVDVGQAGEALAAPGLKYYGHLDLPPGEYLVKTLVREPGTGRASARSVTVEVPASGEPVLSAPFFPEPLGRWVMVREDAAQQQERTVPFPFMMNEQPFLPAARPRIPKGAEVPLYLMGYDVGQEPVELEARVLDASGQTVPGAVVEVDAQSGSDPRRLAARFTAGELAPGEYRLVVRVAGSEATSTIPFVVGR